PGDFTGHNDDTVGVAPYNQPYLFTNKVPTEPAAPPNYRRIGIIVTIAIIVILLLIVILVLSHLGSHAQSPHQTLSVFTHLQSHLFLRSYTSILYSHEGM